jgi:hypothetical protein
MSKISPFYYLLAILILLYFFVALSIPPDPDALSKYNLSVTSAKIISIMVILPFLAIWIIAFRGFIKVKDYAQLIMSTRDGKALNRLGDGLMVIAVSLPITSLAGNIRSYIITQDSSLRPVATIIYNYSSLALVLVGFYLISKGAAELRRTLKPNKSTMRQKLLTISLVAFSVLYAVVTLTNPAREHPTASSPTAAYYLPDLILLLTIVIPYLFVWYFGFRAAYHIEQYRYKAKGILYKQALNRLARGIGCIVASTIMLRLLGSMTTFFSSLTLKGILVVIYLLIAFIAVGYLLVAQGAGKLMKIEEI